MGTEFIMTEDDSLPKNASLLEDVLELSLLTIGHRGGTVDVSHETYPEEY